MDKRELKTRKEEVRLGERRFKNIDPIYTKFYAGIVI